MEQLNLFGEEPQNEKQEVQIQNGEYIYIPNFFEAKNANEFLKAFKEMIMRQNNSFQYNTYPIGRVSC